MKNTTIKKSWRDVSINEYYDLKEKLEECSEPTDEAIVKIAFINNMDEDEVWDLSIDKFRELQVESLWMDEFNISGDIKFKNIEINGSKYSIDTNLQHFTVAQYIDFQTFYSKRKNNERVLGNILSCFIIPKGKKYASDYDITEVISEINSSLDIMTANEILFFFLKQYLILMRATANYFNWILSKVKRKRKSQEITNLEMSWNQMKKTILDGLHLLTM